MPRKKKASYDIEALAIRAQKANEVIRWKAFSWTLLFNRLEDVQPWDVQMASIHPTFRPQGDVVNARQLDQVSGVPVAVEGTAKDLKAFLDLERGLIRSPYFTRVEPERTDRDSQTRETVFRLRFIYDPDVPAGPPPKPEAPEAPEEIEEAMEALADEEADAGPEVADPPGSPAGSDPETEGDR